MRSRTTWCFRMGTQNLTETSSARLKGIAKKAGIDGAHLHRKMSKVPNHVGHKRHRRAEEDRGCEIMRAEENHPRTDVCAVRIAKRWSSAPGAWIRLSRRGRLKLAAIFESGGADVTISWRQGGHELGEDDIHATKTWLSKEKCGRKLQGNGNISLEKLHEY